MDVPSCLAQSLLTDPTPLCIDLYYCFDPSCRCPDFLLYYGARRGLIALIGDSDPRRPTCCNRYYNTNSDRCCASLCPFSSSLEACNILRGRTRKLCRVSEEHHRPVRERPLWLPDHPYLVWRDSCRAADFQYVSVTLWSRGTR